MFTSYEIECTRLYSILFEDVLKTKPRSKGRRKENVKRCKVKGLPQDGKKQQRRKSKGKQRDLPQDEADVTGQGTSTQRTSKTPTESKPKQWRKTTPAELAILKPLENYADEKPPSKVIQDIRQKLGVEWDRGRITRWWRNNVKNKAPSRHKMS